jgi:endoglucanase
MKKGLILLLFPVMVFAQKQDPKAWIRINQLGYEPGGVKVAVWSSKDESGVGSLESEVGKFQLKDVITGNVEFEGKASKHFGAYGPFAQTCRLNFSDFKKPGRYYLQVGDAKSPEFAIGDDVYKRAADFCLRYMRQQRSGFNPFLNDSCHTHDGYVLYGEKAGIPDSTHIDVVGGWHDASDYLQYSATSANATYHLLMAYRDFPNVFSDEKLANGLDGKNGMADVLDEAKWGLDWLLKMHPKPDWMFNQVGDDRDHQGMRIPKEDSFYGKGFERPVYFVSGEPQQRGKFMNNTTGVSSTAAKVSSAFSLGYRVFDSIDQVYAFSLSTHSSSALFLALEKPGVCQTASVKSPYIYAEDNWVDDVELAFANFARSRKLFYNTFFIEYQENPKIYLDSALKYARKEPITPWLGKDTAQHYQWYPFINIGHYELANQLQGRKRNKIIDYYRKGIERVWDKAKQNAFYRGIPFIWCSNNLTTSFAIQCYWYRELTGDQTFSELEQANFDWLFGCNPWGTSMVYGLPAWSDTPVDPHSAFTHMGNYPIDGGLVDGPVYGSIYKNLIGITLYQPDEYAEFQSGLAVYHDDYGDYSTNEPTMDGTASLIYLLAAKEAGTSPKSSLPKPSGSSAKERASEELLKKGFSYSHGAIVRGDSTKKNIAIVFTGDEFADGGNFIARTLHQENIKASFFFTGKFYRNPAFRNIIQQLRKDGHYLGAHSDQHLLYCDWDNRDSLFVNKQEFIKDLSRNYHEMDQLGINKEKAGFFLPPYEWYNDSIAAWTKESGLQLINFTSGTSSNADYTTPADYNYRNSDRIYNSIIYYEQTRPSGLNGFILLLHIGTDSKRTDKFYEKLPQLLKSLKTQGYHFQTVTQLLLPD